MSSNRPCVAVSARGVSQRAVARWMARAKWSQAPDEDAEAMYLTAMEHLEAGLAAWISNVADPARESRHNVNTGATAVGKPLDAAPRDAAWESAGAMSRRPRITSRTALPTERTPAQRYVGCQTTSDSGDALFTGLRLTRGARPASDRAALRCRCLWARAMVRLMPFVEQDLLVHGADCLRLTEGGVCCSRTKSCSRIRVVAAAGGLQSCSAPGQEGRGGYVTSKVCGKVAALS